MDNSELELIIETSTHRLIKKHFNSEKQAREFAREYAKDFREKNPEFANNPIRVKISRVYNRLVYDTNI